MNTIQITVPGQEYEDVTITLDAAEVLNMYNARKLATAKIVELEKKLENEKSYKESANTQREMAQGELQQAHALMNALGIEEKTQEEETYYRKPLAMVTRIALFIAKSK